MEVVADVDKNETVTEQLYDLSLFMENGMRNNRNMKMYVQHCNTLSNIDEKGNEL